MASAQRFWQVLYDRVPYRKWEDNARGNSWHIPGAGTCDVAHFIIPKELLVYDGMQAAKRLTRPPQKPHILLSLRMIAGQELHLAQLAFFPHTNQHFVGKTAI